MPDHAARPKFRRRAEARPDEVLDAALGLFTERGYAQTTMEQVARKAGISKGAVYLYFPSKAGLLEGLVQRAIAPVASAAVAGLGGYRGDPRPVIRRVLTMIVAQAGQPQALAVPQLVIREAVNLPEIAAMYRRDVLDKAIPALTGLIAQGVAGGHIRAVDPELTVRSVVGPIILHLALAEVFDIVPAGGLALDRLVDNHLTLLFAGLDPEKGQA